MDQALKEGRNLEAMKLADEVDWRKVPNIKALTMASEIYEKNKDYTEAREILKLAYERAPHSKQLIYKLTLLSIQDGDIMEMGTHDELLEKNGLYASLYRSQFAND